MRGLPWAAVGSGRPIVVLAGLSPTTGVDGDGFVRATLSPVRKLADRRRLIAINRRNGLSDGLTMATLAGEHADAFRDFFDGPVDIVGASTGGSIAQQIAADHPDVVRRLVLLSSACRLGPLGRELQAQAARELRAGNTKQAVAGIARALVEPDGPLTRGLARAAEGFGGLIGPRLLGGPIAIADLVATIDAEDGFDLADCRNAIAAPTLIVAGGRDRFYSPALFNETARLIPNSQLVIFPGRGHIGVTRDRKALAHIEGFLSWNRG